MRIFVTQPIPEPAESMLKKAGHRVKVYPKDEIIPRSRLLREVRGVHAVLSMLTNKIDGRFFSSAGKQLKIVANYAVGFDNVDLKAAKKWGVMITNTTGVLTESVALHTFALLLAIARRIPEADRFTRAGKYKGWGPKLLLGTDVKDKTLAIVGLGRIGSRVAEMAAGGMGMKVIYNDLKPSKEFEKKFRAKFYKNIDSMLPKADFITLHVPLLPATRHLINNKRLGLMKKSAYLINTSRGPVVDEKALQRALKNKKIAGAALDVFEFEPKLAPGLSKLDNVVLTPHIASASLESRSAMAKIAAQSIIDALRGKKPKNLVRL